MLLTTTVHLVFWTTLVFAVVERSGPRGAKPLTVWTVDHLPEPRAQGAGFVDMVAALVFLAIGAAALIWDQTIGFGFAVDRRCPSGPHPRTVAVVDRGAARSSSRSRRASA